MATPTLTPNFTVLSTCDAATGWTGTTTLDADFKKQGNYALSGVLKTVGVNLAYYTPPSAVNLTNTHIRIWVNFAFGSLLATKANHGMAIYVYDGSTVGLWDMYGVEDYPGGWVLLTIDTSKSFNSGSPNLSSITRIGVQITLTASPRNITTTWVDYLVYGNSMEITGGTSSDPITMEGIAAVDLASGYGAINRNNGVYFVNTALVFGDGSGSVNTYFEDDNRIIVFEDQPVNASLYKIEPVGSATNNTTFNLSNTIIKSANIATSFDLTCNNANLDELNFDANTIINAAETIFKTGQVIENCIWNNCNMVTPGGSTFDSNTITNSAATNALEYPLESIADISNCNFYNNTNAILIATANTYTFDNLKFSGNTYDINNTSGGTVIINATNGSNPSTYLGTVTINNAVTLTITGLVSGSEIRIMQAGTQAVVDGIESSGTSFAYTYNYPTGYNVDIQIISKGYEILWFGNLTLGSSASSLPVTQQVDRNYKA